ncbi:MAG: GNAT family N-acetyltransferase [FCB group bacterium]|jgi:hypothetical protein|nr:GNAT family N-acetyltransferase [FCB group bacterium]
MPETLTLRALDPAEHATWDTLVRASAQGTVYHESPWLNAVARVIDNPIVIHGMFAGERLVAGAPLQLRRRGPLIVAHRAWATPYAGVVVHPDAWDSLRSELRDATQRLTRRFSRLTLAASPFMDSIEAQLPWEQSARATYVLRSRSLEGLWRSLACEVRTQIRRAEREGVTVSIETCPRDFYDIYRDFFARLGLPMPLDRHRFTRFLGQVAEQDLGRLYTARMPDGRLCAACLMVYDRRRAYYSLAASDAALRRNGSESLLVWEAIRNLFVSFAELDLGGANMPHILRFKSKFRGMRIEYTEATVYRTRLERLAIDSFQRTRRMLKR